MLNRYNFASSSFEFSTFLSSRNAKKIACSPHFHLLHLSGVILQDYPSSSQNSPPMNPHLLPRWHLPLSLIASSCVTLTVNPPILSCNIQDFLCKKFASLYSSPNKSSACLARLLSCRINDDKVMLVRHSSSGTPFGITSKLAERLM